jgi:CheY-like chemotaxis protein
MVKMLGRLLGADVELTTLPANGLWNIEADAGQVEQVVMNLAVNARDAMPQGGKLMIETRNATLEEDELQRRAPMTAGDYILLTMSDTGVGMDAETQAHIFEPFFTTKAQGKGTGLGLATVYGVVKQSGGYIWVYSEPGVGSTFKLYLPRVFDELQTGAPLDIGTQQGSATVLVVEDEASLRTFTCTLLRNNGYIVIEAEDGEEALRLAEQYKQPIHLLLTDMIMPGMNGPAVSEKLAAVHSEAKVLFMSGYTGFVTRGLIDPHAVLVSKPFTREELLRKIQQVLGPRTPVPPTGNTVPA